MGRPGPPAAAPRAVARTSAAGSAFSRSEPFGWAPASPGPPRTTCCRWARARPAAGGGGGVGVVGDGSRAWRPGRGDRCRGPAAGASRESRLGGLRLLGCLSRGLRGDVRLRLPSSYLSPDGVLTNSGVVRQQRGDGRGFVNARAATPYLPAPSPCSALWSRYREIEPPGSPLGQVSLAYGSERARYC